MKLHMAVGLSLCVASLMGCPATESPGERDGGPGTDAFVAAVDAPGGGTDAPVVGADAPVAAMVDAAVVGSDGSDAPAGAVTWSLVHASLRTSCGPCHATGNQGGHNIAAADEMAAFTDSQDTSRCAGLSIGACSARRVRDGTMPLGGLAEPGRTNFANLLDRWVAGGQMR